MAFLCPQLRRLDLGQPVDDAAERSKQQRLEDTDDGRHQGHGGDIGTHALGTEPDEAHEAARRRQRLRLGIGWTSFQTS
jgi:hypothetical protein